MYIHLCSEPQLILLRLDLLVAEELAVVCGVCGLSLAR